MKTIANEKESKFNRSKFKDAVKSDELKAHDKQVEDVVKTGQQGHYAGFLTVDQGINKFVFFPSHESVQQMMNENEDVEIKNEPFVVSKQIFWLPREVEDKDDKGNVKKTKNGMTIMKTINMPVFDARIHSDAKKDVVDVEKYLRKLRKDTRRKRFGIE